MLLMNKFESIIAFLIQPLNPSSLPSTLTATIEDPRKKPRKGLGRGVIVAIVVANSVVLLVITSFVVVFYCEKYSRETYSVSGSESGKRRSSYSSEKRVYANNGNTAASNDTTTTNRSRSVLFDRRKQFELEELLRASTEMLGKGSLGTVYKARRRLDGDRERLKDANPLCQNRVQEEDTL